MGDQVTPARAETVTEAEVPASMATMLEPSLWELVKADALADLRKRKAARDAEREKT